MSDLKRPNKSREEDNETTDQPELQKIAIVDNVDNSINYQNDNSNLLDDRLTEMKNEIFISNNRIYFSDLILKSEIPRHMFENDLYIFKSCKNRENEDYFFHFTNIMHDGSISSSLIFMLQFGNGIAEEDCKEDLNQIVNNLNKNSSHLIEELKNYPNDGGNEENGINNNCIDNQIDTENFNFLRGSYYKEINEDDDVYKTNFDIFFTISLINHKTVNFNFKNVEYGKIILYEIKVPTSFFMNQDDVVIVTEMTVKKNYNFKVGFTGIINEAMTCYMNSMLQTLNILGYFKKALFKIPFESDEDIAYTLQRFFYDLSTEKNPVNTGRLVKSFGWSRDQIFIQHDVQEFNMLLSDIMENKMKGTESEGTFKYLFEGKLLNYIKCLEVNYESTRQESISDVQCSVKGCKNIYESLDKYIEEEILDGPDKYEAEGYGKQRATIGKKFFSLPNVMIIQLKRFEYNPKKDQMDKINDYFEYYGELDLKKYLYEPIEHEEYKYTLHSVVVHKGNINHGHYYAFIRPYIGNNWYNFNDETVREADLYEVFEGNYGGTHKIYKHKDRGLISDFNQKYDGNAYILIYIKNSEREKILSKLLEHDIPEPLKKVIDDEKFREKQEELLRIRKMRNINIYLISKETIKSHTEMGIAPSIMDINKDDFLIRDQNFTFCINIPKDLEISNFINFLSKKLKIPSNKIKLFPYLLRDQLRLPNKNNFTMCQLTNNYHNKTFSELFSNITYIKLNKYIVLYIQIDDDLEVFTHNENSLEGEEIETLSENNTIYYSLSQNYRFKENDENITNYNSTNIISSLIIIIKSYDFKSGKLCIEKVITLDGETIDDIDLNQIIDISDIKQKYNEFLKLDQINYNYIVETSSFNLEEIVSKKKEDLIEFEKFLNKVTLINEKMLKLEDLNNIKEFLQNNQTLCIIVNADNTKYDIIESIKKIDSSLYLKLSYRDILIENEVNLIIKENKKFLFFIDEDEIDLKKRIFKYLKENQDMNYLFQDKYDLYFLLDDKLVTSKQFIETLNYDNITLYSSQHFTNEEVEKYPILSTIFVNNKIFPRLEFTISLPSYLNDSEDEDIEAIPLRVILFDIDNNPLSKVIIQVIKKEDYDTLCDTIIDNVYESVIRKQYDNVYQKRNYFFILQNSEGLYAYEIFTKNENLFKFNKNSLSIIFRLQPFSENEISTFDKFSMSKVFIAFSNRDMKPVCDPIILFIPKYHTVLDTKRMIYEKIIRIKKLESLEISFDKLKFYTFSLNDYRPVKDILLLYTKDKDNIFQYCKHNLLVEFPFETHKNNINTLIMS